MEKEQVTFKDYKPDDNVKSLIDETYEEIDEMFEILNTSYPHFNDRTLKQFIDDSQKRANSYVPSREDQGKENWQSNFFSKTTRNKTKALLAGIAKNPPPVSITAYNEKNQPSVLRAEIMKTMVEASFVYGESNPELEMFFDGWDCAINGTFIKYDGYLKVKQKQKDVIDFDMTTGEITIEEKEVLVEDQCIEISISPLNFLVADPNIRNVQDQPAIAWVEYKDKDDIEYEFGDYKDFEYISSCSRLVDTSSTETFFTQLKKRMPKDKQYEVIRYYSKRSGTCYRILVNGVLLLDAPLLWGRKRRKYPFAKTIFEPFADSKFFWGNSFPNILMGEQDVENAFINSLTDKTYRSFAKPLLVGLVNKDSFDLEDEEVTNDTRIYVDDVSQVTPLNIEGPTNGEIAMLKIIRSGLENDSSDSVQSGQAGSGSTAREVVIANERADELKGLFFTMMKDLWLQKYRLRTLNILMNYGNEKITEVVGEENTQVLDPILRVYRLDNTELTNGTMGTKEIEVVRNEQDLSSSFELDKRESMNQIMGKPSEILQITQQYLDDHEYLAKIQTDSMFQRARSYKMALMQEKILGVAKLFPEIFLQNKDKFFKMYMETFGEDPTPFLEGIQSDQMGSGQIAQALGMGQGQQPQQGPSPQMQPSELPNNTNQLSALK